MIQEGHPSGAGDTFVVDQWCLLGGRSPILHLDETRIAEPDFDHDTYRILASYILDTAHQKNIAAMTKEQMEKFFSPR